MAIVQLREVGYGSPEQRGKTAIIVSDCLNALLVIQSGSQGKTRSFSAKSLMALIRLHLEQTHGCIHLEHVKGHGGTTGNLEAHTLARLASSVESPPVSKSQS